jgi:hypothetical protein
MKLIQLLLLITLLVFAVCLPSVHVYSAIETGSSNEDFFFGVTFGGNTTSEAKLLIDEVKGYTNLFIVDNWDVAMDETLLTEICEYAVNANLNVVVYFSFLFRNSSERANDLFKEAGVEPFHIPWLSTAWEKWGDKFLGAYVLDEPGGSQIDVGHYSGFMTGHSGRNHTTFEGVVNYTDAAYRFVRELSRSYTSRLNDPSRSGSIPNSTGRVIPVFTSDYALYWFDYLAGYDAVFAELGWNHNQTQHIALCRGAANVQGKEWGAIITWASNDPPYLASGTEMLQDMNTAYNSGAKYLVVFNYPQINPYGALTEEHFNAMKTFWNQIHTFPRNVLQKVDGQVALVLPKDYGWGMRDGNDNIWGFWPTDELTPVIGEKIAVLLDKYGSELDIIYDEPQFNYTEKYSKIFFWNSTIIFSTVSCEVSSSSITLGSPVTVSGSISPAEVANITIQISTDNGTSLNNLTTITSDSDGYYSFTWTPESVGSYELEALFEEEISDTKTVSGTVSVTVSKILTTLSYSVSSSSITEGDYVTVSGVIDPPVSGKTVMLTIKKPDGSTINRTVTTDSDGSFDDSYKPDAVGYWNVIASWNGDSTYAGAISSEKSFELKSKTEMVLGLPSWMMLIVGSVAAAISIITIVAWFITRPPTQRSNAESEVKAYLISLGNGKLKLIDNTLSFQMEKGFFRKRRTIVRKIPLLDIENMNRTENVLRITWKGFTDIFIIEEAELTGSVFEMIPQAFREQRIMFNDKEVAKQKQNELINTVSAAMENIDLLFDILRSLQRWVDWNHIHYLLKKSVKKAEELKDQSNYRLEMDFSKLSSVIKGRELEEVSKETYNLLRFLYDYFNELATANGSLKQIYHHAKTTIRAYYLLNDIKLGMMVGDKVEKEIIALVESLEGLSKNTGLELNIGALKDIVNKVGAEQQKESVIEETKAVFKKQIENFNESQRKKIESKKLIEHTHPLPSLQFH